MQREAEERALSRAAADLQLGDQYANARSLPQGGALPPPAAAAIAPSDVARQISAAGHQVGARGGSGRVVWGSFERNTGTWCPYPDPEKIEAAYARGDASIFLPECFNAHVHGGCSNTLTLTPTLSLTLTLTLTLTRCTSTGRARSRTTTRGLPPWAPSRPASAACCAARRATRRCSTFTWTWVLACGGSTHQTAAGRPNRLALPSYHP